MAQPTVLCYDPAGAPYLAKLPALCAVQGLRLRRLTAGHLGLTLAQLAQRCDPPITKSALNHRLRKLVELGKPE